MQFDLLFATTAELWVIHDHVRQHDKHGQEWDQDFHTRLMTAILAAEAHPEGVASLLCVEEELWQIDRQVPSALMVGTQPVGRQLLLKVIRLLVKMRAGEVDGDNTDARANAGEGAAGGTPPAAASG